METVSLSVHPNDTHLYFEQNHEPKNLNPMSYQVVAHFYAGREGVPYPTLTSCVFGNLLIYTFCVVDALSLLVNSFYLLSTSHT